MSLMPAENDATGAPQRRTRRHATFSSRTTGIPAPDAPAKRFRGTVFHGDLAVQDNAVVLQHVPHHDVLPHVSVMVSHAGHGSVLTALAHGVPLVCLPNPVADQPGIAARVEALGAGRALDGDNASADEIGAAVRQVLDNSSYAAAARHLATVISNTDGARLAADQLPVVAVAQSYRS